MTSSEVGKRIDDVSGRLATVDEQLEEVTEKLKAKMDGEGGDGTSQTTTIKTAIKRLKSDISAITLRTGLLSAELTAIKYRKVQEALRRAAASRSTRRGLNKSKRRGRTGGGEEGHVALSDDDDD